MYDKKVFLGVLCLLMTIYIIGFVSGVEAKIFGGGVLGIRDSVAYRKIKGEEKIEKRKIEGIPYTH